MHDDILIEEYKKWIISFVDTPDNVLWYDYSFLIDLLFNITFTWFDDDVKLDKNRAEDGYDLRVKFDDIMGTNLVDVLDSYGIKVNVLEVLIALAIRCETDIMGEGKNNYGLWFAHFLKNLDLLCEKNSDFDEHRSSKIIEIWLDREYNFDGSGGLFPIRNPKIDQRHEEIWVQMSSWLIENYYK